MSAFVRAYLGVLDAAAALLERSKRLRSRQRVDLPNSHPASSGPTLASWAAQRKSGAGGRLPRLLWVAGVTRSTAMRAVDGSMVAIEVGNVWWGGSQNPRFLSEFDQIEDVA